MLNVMLCAHRGGQEEFVEAVEEALDKLQVLPPNPFSWCNPKHDYLSAHIQSATAGFFDDATSRALDA